MITYILIYIACSFGTCTPILAEEVESWEKCEEKAAALYPRKNHTAVCVSIKPSKKLM